MESGQALLSREASNIDVCKNTMIFVFNMVFLERNSLNRKKKKTDNNISVRFLSKDDYAKI